MSRIVKNYEIHHVLGEGGMGTVFYAVEVQLRREVALKCLRHDVASKPGVADRFRNEAQAQAQLNHPQIAHLYEYFQFAAEHYMAMEFVNGSTLAKVLRERGRLPYNEAGAYAVQALRGLEHAHRHGIVHRDIKPANLMINKEGQVKVTDFGIARVAGSNRSTNDGMIIGTYEYISPEAAQAQPATGLSDLYSLGVVLYELITGRLPFESPRESELLRMQIQAPRPSVRSLVKDVPAPVDEIVQRAMDRKASRRFRSAEEMAEALERCLEPASKRNTPTGIMRFFSLGGETLREKTPSPAPAERRRTDISSTCHRVEDLLEQHLWNEAGSLLDAGLRNHPDETELIDLRSRAQRQRQQYEQAIAQQVDLIRDLLNRGLAEEALKVAGSALVMYSRAAALVDLQRECRQRVEVAKSKAGELVQVQERVDKLLSTGQFRAAREYVLELTEEHQNQNELNKLLKRSVQAEREAEKQAAVQQYLSQAGEAADAGLWEQALAVLDGALSRFPGEPNLQGHRRTLHDRWQAELRRRAVEEIVAEARTLELSGSIRAARERLARDLDKLDRDEALLQQLARIDAALEATRRAASIDSAISAAARLRGERKWPGALDLLDQTTAREGRDARIDELRATLSREFRGHQDRVAQAAAEARGHIQDDRWEPAVMRLSTAVRELPGERVLIDLMQEAQRGLAQKRRAETIARIKAEAGQCAAARNFPEALRLLLDAVSQYPDDEVLSAALSQTIFDRDAYVAQEKVKAALESCTALRKEERYGVAIEVLQGALKEVRGNHELQSALWELELEWREFRMRRTVQEVTAVVEASLESENYPPALDRLAQGLAEWPGEPELLELDRRTRAAQRQTAVRKAIDGALEQGNALEEALRWDDSADMFKRTLAEFPETADELGPRIAAARERAVEARRLARIAELGHNVTEWMESGLLDEGDEELQGAEREFPNEPVFAGLRELVTAERRRIARATAIRKALDEAHRLLTQRSFDEADAVLRSAEREVGPDAALNDLLVSVDAAKQAHLAAVEAAFAAIQARFDERDWDGAISAAVKYTEQFPDEPRFRALLGDARKNRDLERRRNEIARRISRIDALLGEDSFDDAEVQVRNALRDFPDESAFTERSQRLREERQAHAQAAAFRQLVPEVQRLRRERQWERSRQMLTPYRDGARTQAPAEALLAELSAEEAQYRIRTRELEERARTLTAAKQYEEALVLLEQAAREFPEVGAFAHLLAEVRSGSAAEKKARRLDSAERTIRSLLAMWRYEEALAEADGVLGEYPGEQSLRALRALIVAGIEEKAAVAGVAGAVERLIAAGEGTDADRVLVDGLRRYPGRAELANLRAAVDAARKAEWDRKSREAGLKRSLAAVEKLLGKGKLTEAGAALEALVREYGEESAPGLAQRIGAAVAERERENERLRLAEEERQREAERRRLAEEERQREIERQRLAAEEQRRRQEEQRQAEALEAAFAQSEAEVGRLSGQRQWEQARQLIAPYLEHAGTQARAAARLAELAEQEARYRARVRELEEQAADMMGANRHPDVLALLEPAVGEFPEVAAFPRLLAQAREGLAAEQKAQRLSAAERTIYSRMVAQQHEDALAEADAALADYPGEQSVLDLRAAIVARMEEKAAVSGVVETVERLVAAGEGTEADRALVEGLRRYPNRAELSNLRAAVDAARQAEGERKAREAGLKRAVAGINRLLGKGKLAEASAALEALEQAYGAGAAPEIAQRVGSAVAEAERLRLAEEERRREAERQRLAEEEQRREAERQRLAEEEQRREAEQQRLAEEERRREAERLLEVERERLAEEEREREAERQRLAAEEQLREAERQRLAEEERLRLAEEVRLREVERQHLAEEEREREVERQRLAEEAERQHLTEEQRAAEALQAAFRQSVDEAARLCAQRQWEQARHLIAPHLENAGTQSGATAKLAELAEQEARYHGRIREVEEEAANLVGAKRYQEAVALLEPAAGEFPEVTAFPRLLDEARDGLAAEQKAGRLSAAEETVHSRMAEQRYPEALAEADAALADYPAEPALLDLRARVEEQAAVAGVVGTVERLAEAGEGTKADRVLIEGLRRYPGRAELSNLRAAVDAARQTEGERKSRQAGLKRAVTGIHKLLGKGKLAEAGAALESLEKVYGAGAAPEVAQRLGAAVAEREREEERQRLAEEERRQAAALEAAFRQSEAEVSRLCRQRQWEQARQLVAPYLENARTQPAAAGKLAELAEQEAFYRGRIRELEEQAANLMAAHRYREVLALIEPAGGEFPEAAGFPRLLTQARDGLAAEQKAQRLSAAERTIYSLMAEQRHPEALSEADAALADDPGEKTLLDLRAAIVAGIEEKAAVARVVGTVERLAGAGEGSEADRALVEGLRRYPGRTELSNLRAAVDAARQVEWDRKAREAGLQRALTGIDRLLGAGKLEEAGAELEALEREFGEGSAPGVAQRIGSAVTARQRERERQRQAAEEERAAQALEDAFRQSVDEVGRLAQQQQWEQARQVAAPYLENARTLAPAEILLRGLARQEQNCVRMRELEEQARTRLGAKQYQEAMALMERAVREFPEGATFAQLLSEAREGFAPELKAQRLSAAEHSIRLRIAEQRHEEAVAEADAALSEHPGEKAIRSLRMQAAAGVQEKAAVAGVAGEVQRLIALGEGIESDRVLAEGLRRYPGRAELTIMRPAVDAAQKTEANRKSREARLKRAVAGIGRLLGKGKGKQT